MSPQGANADRSYLLVPNYSTTKTGHLEAAAREMDELEGHTWMVATIIEDDDLTFGGKPLSTWYEEERSRQSMAIEYVEEERRGRQRERPRAEHQHHHHKHQSRAKNGKEGSNREQ